MILVLKRSARARPSVACELVVVTSAALLYFAVRGLTVGNEVVAAQNAHALVSWETRLGIYLEPAIQGLVEHSYWLTMLMNWVYIWGHWPVIIMTLLWLVRHHPEGYRQTRNAMLLSGGLALAVFAAYPMAPPRLANLGFVDTVTEYSTSYRVLQPNALVNQYAAMPSLHVGWNLLIGLALISYARHRVLRAAGALLPVLMVVSVVSTGNHYVADAAAGILLVLACRVLMYRLECRRRGWSVGAPAQSPDGRVRAPGVPIGAVRVAWADSPSTPDGATLRSDPRLAEGRRGVQMVCPDRYGARRRLGAVDVADP